MRFFIIVLLLAQSLWAEVQHSVVPLMDGAPRDLTGKINRAQRAEMDAVGQRPCLRVMSFNMLFNLPFAEKQLDKENRWKKRAPRLIEYLQFANADLIGSQELQKDQLEYIMESLGGAYGYFGVGSGDGASKGDISAIFYKKNRLCLLEGRTYFFSETPLIPSDSPFTSRNTFTYCHFKDMQTGQELLMLNTHLAFGNIERRYYEARKLQAFVNQLDPTIPLLITGDFNTFPFRQELELPFYDGDCILSILEDSTVKDALPLALYGHFGPLSSTNYSSTDKKSFASEGTPGVILDHILVNPPIRVLRHALDPARVNGYFPSDHFPLITDLVIGS